MLVATWINTLHGAHPWWRCKDCEMLMRCMDSHESMHFRSAYFSWPKNRRNSNIRCFDIGKIPPRESASKQLSLFGKK